jgi:hypothetical protein
LRLPSPAFLPRTHCRADISGRCLTSWNFIALGTGRLRPWLATLGVRFDGMFHAILRSGRAACSGSRRRNHLVSPNTQQILDRSALLLMVAPRDSADCAGGGYE